MLPSSLCNKFITSWKSMLSDVTFQEVLEEVSLERYLSCINICMDYIPWILAFSANYKPHKITENFPFTKHGRKYKKKQQPKNKNRQQKIDSNDISNLPYAFSSK